MRLQSFTLKNLSRTGRTTLESSQRPKPSGVPLWDFRVSRVLTTTWVIERFWIKRSFLTQFRLWPSHAQTHQNHPFCLQTQSSSIGMGRRCPARPQSTSKLCLLLCHHLAVLLCVLSLGGGKALTRVVHTKNGRLQGFLRPLASPLQPLEVFLGVPYATPPVGINRLVTTVETDKT